MTPAHAFDAQSFAFLETLAAHNDRGWFTANKAVFTTRLEQPFVHLLETLSNRLADASRPLSGSKATVFRMNRDVRFSEDKRPYKRPCCTNQGLNVFPPFPGRTYPTATVTGMPSAV